MAEKCLPPRGACDCHAHVFGPLDRFPFIATRSYTPAERLASDYRALLDSLGIDRGVIVHPSSAPTIGRL